jgi:hypothetical protein
VASANDLPELDLPVQGRNNAARSVWFILFIWLIWFIWLLSFNQNTKQTKQTK